MTLPHGLGEPLGREHLDGNPLVVEGTEGDLAGSADGAHEPDVFSEDGGGAHGLYRFLWHKVICFC